MPKKILSLIDGSYLMFRNYHGMPPLSNDQGEPTGAIFGFINTLRRLISKYQPDHLAVIFDAKGKNFRNDLYADYKANRPPVPDELVRQIAPIHEIIRAMGVPLLIIDNVEADDVIATLATMADKQGLKVFISSSDKDLAQLINDNIYMHNALNSNILDKKGVEEKYGVPPATIADYLALVGDSIDNIPGIPKVGPKTAAKWLQQYQSLQEIIKHADSIKGKVGENLRANVKQLALSRKLVTLKLDVEIPLTLKQLVLGDIDTETLRKAYQRWQFQSWLSELNIHKISDTERGIPRQKPVVAIKATSDQQGPIIATDRKNYQTILTMAELESWLEKLQQSELFALDTETTTLDYMQAKLVGLSLATAAGEAAYIPMVHDYDSAPPQLSRELVLEKLRPLLEDRQKYKLGHHLKYDKNILANHGIDLVGIQHDSMLQSYVLDSTADSRHNMATLARKYLQKDTILYEDIAGKGQKQIPFNQITIDQASPYAAEDADITLQLHQYLWPKLCENKKLQHIYETLEIPLLPVLSQMERNGVVVDADMLEKQSQQLESNMINLEQQIYQLTGKAFNINSPKQLQTILFQDIGLQSRAKTPKGDLSTSESVLQELAYEHELPGLILKHRSLNKLKTTYTDTLPKQINRHSQRVHTSYHQAVASTGRLSSSAPNLQNIPIRTKQGRRIRQAFIAPPEHLLVTADYSQIELRIMAHLSQDDSLLEAFRQQQDVHVRTAAECFGIPLEQVSREQRRAAKAINFGLIYGMSAFGLARQLGIRRNEAKDYIDKYFQRYPSVKNYMETTRQQAYEQGYVETVFGRRLYLSEINSRNAVQRRYAERTAINAPMQGTAADIIKLAMINITAWLNKNHPDTKLIMQVHDELVFEIPIDKTEQLIPEISNIMTNTMELSIPLSVDIGTGNNWDSAH